MKPEQGQSRTPFERIPKDGVKYYRILPPYGTNNNRQLFHKYAIHWGFLDESGNKKPVSCSLPTEGYCPVCVSVMETEDLIKRKKDAGASEDECSTLTQMVRERKAQKFYVYNAVSYDEKKVVVLQLPWTASEELKRKMVIAVNEKGFDPTSLTNGGWFRFERTGTGLKTKYFVDFKKETVVVDGEKLEKNDRTPLPESLLNTITRQYSGEITDGPLVDIHALYETRTAEELSRYLNGSPIKPKRSQASGSTTSAQADPPAINEAEEIPVTKAAATAGTTPTATTAEKSIEDEIQRLQNLQKKLGV